MDPLTASGKPVQPQSWNRYQYCLNNPLLYTDPTGLIWGIYTDSAGNRWVEWFEDRAEMMNSGHEGITEATELIYDMGNGYQVRLNPLGPQGHTYFLTPFGGGVIGLLWHRDEMDYIVKGYQIESNGKGLSGRWLGTAKSDLFGDTLLGAVFGGAGGFFKPTPRPFTGAAATAADEFAAGLRARGMRPTAATAAVDTTTGQTFFGVSGNPLPNVIHPDLAGRMPSPSLEPWSVANCAEFKAVNNALLGGSKVNSLELHTIRTATGEIMPRCANCRITTAGTKVTSDPK